MCEGILLLDSPGSVKSEGFLFSNFVPPLPRLGAPCWLHQPVWLAAEFSPLSWLFMTSQGPPLRSVYMPGVGIGAPAVS